MKFSVSDFDQPFCVSWQGAFNIHHMRYKTFLDAAVAWNSLRQSDSVVAVSMMFLTQSFIYDLTDDEPEIPFFQLDCDMRAYKVNRKSRIGETTPFTVMLGRFEEGIIREGVHDAVSNMRELWPVYRKLREDPANTIINILFYGQHFTYCLTMGQANEPLALPRM